MEKKYISLVLFCSLFLKRCLSGTTLSKNQCGFLGESVSLSCTLPPAEFVQPLTWSNDIIVGTISNCVPGGCSAPANSRYTASADANGIYMTIANLARADDETTWKCTLQGQSPSSINLIVRDYPTTCVLSKVDESSFKCETDCGYPTSDLTIGWFINTTSGSVISLPNQQVDIDTTATPVCSSGGKASATFPASDISDDGNLHCKCGMQTACSGKALITSNIIPVTGTTTPPPTSTPKPRPCQCSWLPCGWKCYYMYIIIVAVVLLVCLVVGLCCCYRRGYFGMGSKKENSRENSHVNKAYTSDTENGQPARSSGRHREQTPL